MLECCNLCGFKCNVNRNERRGVCGLSADVKVSLVSIHNWEEPCISGTKGSGTVFFTGCNLSCMFCQNYEISQDNFGKVISIDRLAEIFIEQQERGVHNINLVSPTPYVPAIIKALDVAKKKGLTIPIVYNTNGYDSIETIKMLDGYVDIYLPDFKYFDDDIAFKYSKVPNYFENVSNLLIEMQKQVGKAQFDENGIMRKGLIIRHLIMPGNVLQTKKVLDWIKENMPKDIYISIMAQYFPTYKAKEDSLINRKISKREYDMVLEMIQDFENGYVQELR